METFSRILVQETIEPFSRILVQETIETCSITFKVFKLKVLNKLNNIWMVELLVYLKLHSKRVKKTLLSFHD